MEGIETALARDLKLKFVKIFNVRTNFVVLVSMETTGEFQGAKEDKGE